jgi:PTH1 family peptidyl-tRNA hydrolase
MLFIGLGNPGSQYERNRHNVGFMAIDTICKSYPSSPEKAQFQGILREVKLEDEKVFTFKPLTFMNRCGPAVAELVNFYKISLDEVVVIHDDLDLVPGKVRLKRGGGAGGHNGLRSLDAHISSDYWRLRVGIGHPGHRDLVTSYVLGNFRKEDDEWLPFLLSAIADEIGLLVKGNSDKFQSAVAQRLVSMNLNGK